MTDNKFDLMDSEARYDLDRISNSVRGLRFCTDAVSFVHEMISLGELLGNVDGDAETLYPAINENTKDPTYFIAAYFGTQNILHAFWIYRIVRSLTRYILLSDRFHETGDEKYALLASQMRASVIRVIESEPGTDHLRYSMDNFLAQFSEFWELEKVTRRRMSEGCAFSYTEIRHFLLSKSSDARLIYASVLDATVPNFNADAALILHYNQALLDILDDWEDIEDDVNEDLPNIFVMAALENIPYKLVKEYPLDRLRAAVLSGSELVTTRLIDEIEKSILGVSVPQEFIFLRMLSGCYVDTIMTKLSSPIFGSG